MMSTTEEEKRLLIQGRDTPDSAEVRVPGQAPLGRHQATVQVEAGSQASTSATATGGDKWWKTARTLSLGALDSTSPFRRSSCVKRTPPKRIGGEKQEKAEVFSSPEEAGKRKRRDEVNNLEATLNKIAKRIANLEVLVKNNTNTKKEIKENVEALRCLGEHLKPERLSRVFDSMMEVASTKQARLTEQSAEPAKKAGVEVSTQTEGPWGRVKPPARIVTELGETESFTEFQRIAESPWDVKVFQCTATRVGNPLATDRRVVKVVLVEPKDPDMKTSVQKMYKDRFPEIVEATGPFEVYEQTTKRRSATPGEAEPSQKVIRIAQDGTEACVWERLVTLREECREEDQVAIHHLETMALERLQKMTECIFRKGKTKVTIFTTQRKKEEVKETLPSLPKKKTTNVRERATCALTVSGDGKSYKEVLQSVRAALGTKAGSDKIKAIRSTKDNKLLIVMDKDQAARDLVKKHLTEADAKLRTRSVGTADKTKVETFHIRGLDALTDEEEIKKAIVEKMGDLEGIKIGQIRPAANNTQAATVVVQREDVQKLEEAKHIRVGPVRCPIERRVPVRQCGRCWGYDHTAQTCKGPDRKKLCRKCGEEGHQERACLGQMKCFHCNTAGHKTGSGKCKAFQTALTKARRTTPKTNRGKSRSDQQAPKQGESNDEKSPEAMAIADDEVFTN